MARNLSWYWRRFRAMSPAEILHRSKKAIRHPFDVALMRTGLYAPTPSLLACWRGPQTFYFDSDLVATPLSAELHVRAERICRGEREVLGLGWLALPDAPWHLEPSQGRTWPRNDATRVLGRPPPGFDARLTWEINRGHEWVLLARAWSSTRDSRYRDRLLSELSSWRRENPLGIGINWASPMEAAIRIHSLAWVAGFLRGERLGYVAEMIYMHGEFVHRNLSAFSSANNHLIVELTGLIVAARCLGDPAVMSAWHAPACRSLEREVESQVYSDGVNVEMATHYHAFVLEALLLVIYLERAHDAGSHVLESVARRMADYLNELLCEDGEPLLQGDCDDGKIVALLGVNHLRQVREAAAALNRSIAAPPPCLHEEGVFWLTGGRRPSVVPNAAKQSRHFERSGQVVLRTTRVKASVDAGPFGFGPLFAHAHCDALAVNVAIDGRPLLVDRGTGRYNGDVAARTRFRRTAAHNVLQLADREQGDTAGLFMWARIPRASVESCSFHAAGAHVVATHDGYAPWRHRRTVASGTTVLVVLDELIGPPTAERSCVRFHFAPDLTVALRATTNGSIVEARDRVNKTLIAWLWVNTESARITQFPHSARYAAETTGETLECALTSGSLVTWLGPGEAREYADDIERVATSARIRSVPGRPS